MKALLDTNIVLRNANRSDAQHGLVADWLRRLVEAGADLCVAPQVLYEYWVVATRPAEVNGLGLSIDEARASIATFRDAYALLPDPPELLDRWLELCTRHTVSGRPAHDARLVAYMLCHDIEQLLTLNADDFTRYGEIRCLSPA
jgi:predicted nucleic acid-binding protein